MTSLSTYLKWLSMLCAVLALFGIGIFIIGYKDPSFGRVATVVLLIIAAIVLGLLSRRKRYQERSDTIER